MKTQLVKDPETTAPDQSPQGERTHRSGRAAMVIAALAVSGAGLTALVIGVTGGSDTEAPADPGTPPSVEVEVPPRGVDQRLYELADKYAARMEAQQQPGPDQRLYELADKHAARLEAQQQPGPDQRLYELADKYAAEMRAQR